MEKKRTYISAVVMTNLIHNKPDGKMRTIKAERPHLWEEGKAGVLFLASRMASALPAEAIKDINL